MPIIWIALLIVVSYAVGIFLAPEQTDKLGWLIGTAGLNQKIRDFKSETDNVSTKIMDAKNGTGELYDEMQNLIKKYDEAKKIADTKIDQTKRVIDTAQQLGNTASELKNNLSDLSTLSGSAASGSTSSGTNR